MSPLLTLTTTRAKNPNFLMDDVPADELESHDVRISLEVTSQSPQNVLPSSQPSPNSHEKSTASPLNLRPQRTHISTDRTQSRKLIAHLLTQLQSRPMPPPVFDDFKSNGEISSDRSLSAIVETVRGVVKFKNGKQETRSQLPTLPGEDDGDEEEKDNSFTTDATYDLMVKLKDVLVISVAQGWEIFHDNRYSNMSSPDIQSLSNRRPLAPHHTMKIIARIRMKGHNLSVHRETTAFKVLGGALHRDLLRLFLVSSIRLRS